MRTMIIPVGTKKAVDVCGRNIRSLAIRLELAVGKDEIEAINDDISKWVLVLCMAISEGAKYSLKRKV